MRSQKNWILIDIDNLNKGGMANGIESGSIDIYRFKKYLEMRIGMLYGGMFSFDRGVFFMNDSAKTQLGSEKLEGFKNYLRTCEPRGPGFTVRAYAPKAIKAYSDEVGHKVDVWQQGGIDVGVAVELVAGAAEDDYDVCVLVSGDGDYEDAVRYATERRKKDVIVVAFDNTISNKLQCLAKHVIALKQSDAALFMKDQRF